MTTITKPDLVGRALDLVADCFTPEVAKRVIGIRAGSDFQTRLDELAERNAESLITPEELDEYDALLRIINYVTYLQLRARKVIENGTGP
jgi:hypothetical protein